MLRDDPVIMDRMDCGCVSNRKGKRESRAPTQEQIVCVTVPEDTVEVMKFALTGTSSTTDRRASHGRACDDALAAAAQAQYTHKVMDVPVHGRARGFAGHGGKRQVHRSQQQQQHQAVHEENEEEKEESKEKEGGGEKKGQGQGGHEKEEARRQREREEEWRG